MAIEAKSGRVWHAATAAAGVTVPIFSNTTNVGLLVYVPAGAKYAARLYRSKVGYVSGTMVAGHMCYGVKTGLNAAPTSTTDAILWNGRIGSAEPGAPNAVRVFQAATLAAALTYFGPMGNSQVVQAATATNAPWRQVDELDGSIIVTPGSLFGIVANVAAAVVATQGLTFEEIDW